MKPVASLSLDLDNQWSYMKTHGDAGWDSFPSYLDIVVPRVLERMDRLGVKITFFIVGQDAALSKNHAALREITAAGHEVGNHSFNHEPWLHTYAPDRVERELASAEEAIAEATGELPRGFRGPGFSLSKDVLEVLCRRGYLFDASTFPTFIGPLARAYYFFNSGLSRSERKQRDHLFGGIRDGLRPLKPYRWELDGGSLLEIPVTTMPLLRAPFHLSYILYLSGYSPTVARTYFRAALAACRASGIQPSLLLHPLDFLGGDDVDALRFFPGMQIEARDKLAVVDRALGAYARLFEVLPMSAHARRIREAGRTGLRRPVHLGPGAGLAKSAQNTSSNG